MANFVDVWNLLSEWLDSYGYVALALAVMFASLGAPIPRGPLIIASGAIFGLLAIPVILLSSAIGAIFAFLLSKYLFADRFRKFANDRPKLRAILRAADQEAFRTMALLRFCSPVPGAVQNYLYGLIRIGVLPFALAILIFPIPAVCLYVYLGILGRAALNRELSGLDIGLAVLGLSSLALAILLVRRRVRAALQGQNAGSG